jgi:hypothetical protein
MYSTVMIIWCPTACFVFLCFAVWVGESDFLGPRTGHVPEWRSVVFIWLGLLVKAVVVAICGRCSEPHGKMSLPEDL